jgi:hypothetical protein
MKLYDRLHPERAPERACRDSDAQDGWCLTHPGGAFTGRGARCDRAPVVQSPFTRAALRGDLPAKELG